MSDLAETPEFLERLRRREPEACREMIVGFGPELEGYALHLLGDRQHVDDLVQESLVAALEALPRFDGRSRLRTWLFSILHHKAYDRIRQVQRERSREVPLEADDPLDGDFDDRGHIKSTARDERPDPEQLAESGQLRDRLSRAVNDLPARNREAFLLRDVHGLDMDEAAQIMDVTGSHFRVLLHRARVTLRKTLMQDGGVVS
jgi:RNA polymerase sigma-70 factor (ECF subfamily)